MFPSRRRFMSSSLSAAAGLLAVRPFAWGASLTARERVTRAFAGQDVDRPPLTLWHHFGLESKGPAAHADATLAFHRAYGTDLVKVMSDFPFPRPAGEWFTVREQATPFPAQLEALRRIASGVQGGAPLVETIFNPWNVAEKLSSPEAVQQLRREQPQRLLDALEAIARSEANHARQAVAAGASGIFLAIANAQPQVLGAEDYATYSEPFDRIVLDAVRDAPINILHLHGDDVYLSRFTSGWRAAAINYSIHGTKVPLRTTRTGFDGVLVGGIDETRYRTLDVSALRTQAEAAVSEAGVRLVLAPGCSVPNEATPDELARLRRVYPSS